VSTLDVILLVAVGFFMIRGLWRGFIRETVGLVGLFGAGIAAAWYAEPAGAALAQRGAVGPEIAPVAAGGAIFLATYVAVNLVGFGLDRLGRALFLGPLLRLAGMAFAALKAGLLLGVMLIAGQRFAPWLVTPELVDSSRIAGPLMTGAARALDVGGAWIGRAMHVADGSPA